jgi:hypothetical protein
LPRRADGSQHCTEQHQRFEVGWFASTDVGWRASSAVPDRSLCNDCAVQ